jgi:hypothetical protein
MTDHDGTAHRSLHDPQADEVSLRDAEEVESGDGMMEIRMPIASSGEVRNDGDDPLSDAELRGMASQVDDLTRGVFPEHGNSDAVDDSKYSQFEKLGYWSEADLQREASADGEDLLMATARMPDPETLPATTGDYRESLAILKEQAKRGIPISASIGWRDDEDAPGGVDLMEASIVGIGADSRTTTEGGTEALARAAVDAGADPQEFVAAVARAVTDGARPLGPPGDRDRFESFAECKATLQQDDDISEEDAERICGAWEQASAADNPDQEHDMTDNDPPADEEGTTEEEQSAPDDGAEQTRAPEDVSEDDLLTFTAMHFEGMDESDLMQAVDAADGAYIGECDPEALADLVSEATGAEYGDVVDAMDALMSEGDGEEPDDEQGEYGDDEDEDEEDDEDEGEMNTSDADDADGERAADTEDADALTERVAELEHALAELRSPDGDAEADTPDAPETDDGDTEERAADGEESETTDADDDRATAGPNWRA